MYYKSIQAQRTAKDVSEIETSMPLRISATLFVGWMILLDYLVSTNAKACSAYQVRTNHESTIATCSKMVLKDLRQKNISVCMQCRLERPTSTSKTLGGGQTDRYGRTCNMWVRSTREKDEGGRSSASPASSESILKSMLKAKAMLKARYTCMGISRYHVVSLGCA